MAQDPTGGPPYNDNPPKLPAKPNGGRQLSLSDDMVKRLIAGIAKSRSSTPLAGGKPYLKLLKHGVWAKGAADDPIQEGCRIAVNPICEHGWAAWSNANDGTKNELLGEVMVPVDEDKPPKPASVRGYEYKEQRAVHMKILDGEDAGEEITYKNSSLGGLRAIDELFKALTEQLINEPSRPVAVVQLGVDSYPNKKYGGLTFTPVFEIVDWIPMDGPDNEPPAGPKKAKLSPKPAAAAAAAARPGAAPRRQRPSAR